jgi:LTXXQ motif family protein
MRRTFLVLLALSIVITAFPPEPSDARSLLSFLGIRIGGRHHAHHSHRHSVRVARGHTHWVRAAARGPGAAATAGAAAVTTGAAAAMTGGASAVPGAAAAMTGGAPPTTSGSSATTSGVATATTGRGGASTTAGAAPMTTGGTSVTPGRTSLASLYWPSAYDDLVRSTFALVGPADKDQFWGHEFNDIFTGALTSPDASRQLGARRRAAPDSVSDASATEGCASSDNTGGLAATAFKQIEQRVAPTQAQQADFDNLRSAMIQAEERVNSVCSPPFATSSPPERLKAITDRLWALRQAMLLLRTPLEKAYDSLSDAQKAQLNAKKTAVKIACTDAFTGLSWPRDQLEQAIQPNDEQRGNLETLRLVSLQMAQAIVDSCPTQPLASPVQRLDAAGDRLNNLLYAAMIFSRTFGNFYASLTEEQKASLRAVTRTLGNRRAADAATSSSR